MKDKLVKKGFDDEQFHDSFLLSMNFADLLNKITLLFWCPSAGEDWEQGRYLQIVFDNLIFFGFEAAPTGLSGSGSVMFNEVGLEENSERAQIWIDVYTALSKLGNTYPDIAAMAKNAQVYHFVFDGYPFQGKAFLDKGFQIMCQNFEVSDVTYNMPSDTPKYYPSRIDSQ